MSFEIITEIHFLFATILLGVAMTFLYDCLFVIRNVIRHKQWIVSLEDLFYCFCCFIFSFALLYRENNGMIRWFSIMGVALGMILYKMTLSYIYIRYMTRILSYIGELLTKILFFISRPTRKISRVFTKSGRTLFVVMKNKLKIIRKYLTRRAKVIKILISNK